jgi:NitT/TauT family transport system ATP-binding protein
MTPRFFSRRRELRMQAMDYLLRIGLREADAGKYPDQLSGGMQQRVAIAQALMTQPRILLMDEAFSALDPGTRRDMQKLIRQLWRDTRTTVLFVTHNTQEALSMATRVVVLAKEDPAHGSKVMLDMVLSQPCREDDMPHLIAKVEHVCGSTREAESALFMPV